MKVVKEFSSFVCFFEDTVESVLKRINENKSRVLFVLSEHAKLLGVVTDGDIRRWMITTDRLDLATPIAKVMNTEFKYITNGASGFALSTVFKDGVSCIPKLDESGHLIELIFQYGDGFSIDKRDISELSPAYIIAEIGNNHQGDINIAKRLVDAAAEAKVDCVKFQMRNVKQLYKSEGGHDASADLGAQYTMDLLSKFQLSNDELVEVFDYCKDKGITVLCTPWDLDSLLELEKYGMPAYKVASADFTNFELLEAVSRTGKPFFCSTGMSSELEIKETVAFLNSLGSQYVLLHCNSTYPTPFKDVQLNYLTQLSSLSSGLVGYSGHERGIEVPIAAIALGAKVIEKHLTLDKTLEGNDHKVSLLPEELALMVSSIRNVEESLGVKGQPREITQGELMNRENLAKSIVAKVDVKKGDVISRDMLECKSPGQGLQPNNVDDLVGRVAVREIKKNDFFYKSDIEGIIEKPTSLNFSRPVGVPARYHDYHAIIQGTSLDFVEFHLSYRDLDEGLEDFFNGPESIGFAVHSPELFEGDHLLDLCNPDPHHRARSIRELTRVVEVTNSLKKYFPKTAKPVIVVNAGGWKVDGFIDAADKKKLYALIAESLDQIDTTGVTIAIQTMPPFPWHFGGQSYHNLFLCADEIVDFCNINQEYKICLDISHSMMSCNYYGWDLIRFVEKIAPFNVHMHVVDAKGPDGEGVEVGQGDVDFRALSNVLAKYSPNVQFIPEVWQGHKNNGEGFWKALNYLEQFKF